MLVLKGIYHYCKFLFVFFPRGLNQMEVSLDVFGHFPRLSPKVPKRYRMYRMWAPERRLVPGRYCCNTCFLGGWCPFGFHFPYKPNTKAVPKVEIMVKTRRLVDSYQGNRIIPGLLNGGAESFIYFLICIFICLFIWAQDVRHEFVSSVPILP